MKKKTFIISMLCLTLIGGSINVLQAQETKQEEQQQPEKKKSKFGSFVRKVGESATGINMSNETFVAMNMDAQRLIEIQVASCVRDTATNHVLLTLTVKAKQDGVKTGLGKPCGNGNQECVSGYDTQGNTFTGQEVGTFTQVSGNKENPMNVPVKYEFVFADIPPALHAIEVVTMEFYISAKSGNVGSNMSKIEPIQVRNIQITWE